MNALLVVFSSFIRFAIICSYREISIDLFIDRINEKNTKISFLSVRFCVVVGYTMAQVTWPVLFSTTTQVRLGQVTWLLVIGLLGGSLGAPWGLLGGSAGAPWGLRGGSLGAPWGLPRSSAGAPRGLLGDLSGASGLPGGSVRVPRGPSYLARFYLSYL